jgi:hypothetical protein
VRGRQVVEEENVDRGGKTVEEKVITDLGGRRILSPKYE